MRTVAEVLSMVDINRKWLIEELSFAARIAEFVHLISSSECFAVYVDSGAGAYRATADPMHVPGHVRLRTKTLLSYLKTMPGEKCSLAFGDGHLAISSEHIKTKFWTTELVAGEGQASKAVTGSRVDCADLLHLLSVVESARAKERGARVVLDGVRLVFTPTRLTAMASDGHRAAIAWLDGSFDTELDIVLSGASPGLLMALLRACEPGSIVECGSGHLHYFACGGRYLGLPKELGNFPKNIETIVGKLAEEKPAATWPVLSETMATAIKRVGLSSDQRTRCIRVESRPSENDEPVGVAFHSNVDGDTADEFVPVDGVGDMKLAINGDYLQSAIGSIGAGAELRFFGAEKAILLQRDGAQIVVMPQRR